MSLHPCRHGSALLSRYPTWKEGWRILKHLKFFWKNTSSQVKIDKISMVFSATDNLAISHYSKGYAQQGSRMCVWKNIHDHTCSLV